MHFCFTTRWNIGLAVFADIAVHSPSAFECDWKSKSAPGGEVDGKLHIPRKPARM